MSLTALPLHLPRRSWQGGLRMCLPNQPDQADIPPRKAAEEWILLQEKYPDKLLVSPATGHADTEWFDAFWEACQELGCRIDYLATHMYDGDADLVMETLEAYSKRYGNKKIWFTEFARRNTHSEVLKGKPLSHHN